MYNNIDFETAKALSNQLGYKKSSFIKSFRIGEIQPKEDRSYNKKEWNRDQIEIWTEILGTKPQFTITKLVKECLQQRFPLISIKHCQGTWIRN